VGYNGVRYRKWVRLYWSKLPIVEEDEKLLRNLIFPHNGQFD